MSDRVGMEEDDEEVVIDLSHEPNGAVASNYVIPATVKV
jgi:hypothetical protein